MCIIFNKLWQRRVMFTQCCLHCRFQPEKKVTLGVKMYFFYCLSISSLFVSLFLKRVFFYFSLKQVYAFNDLPVYYTIILHVYSKIYLTFGRRNIYIDNTCQTTQTLNYNFYGDFLLITIRWLNAVDYLGFDQRKYRVKIFPKDGDYLRLKWSLFSYLWHLYSYKLKIFLKCVLI